MIISKTVDFSCLTVISMKSARHVIDALNAEGEHIDLILAEVGLRKKGMRILKYAPQDRIVLINVLNILF